MNEQMRALGRFFLLVSERCTGREGGREGEGLFVYACWVLWSRYMNGGGGGSESDGGN